MRRPYTISYQKEQKKNRSAIDALHSRKSTAQKLQLVDRNPYVSHRVDMGARSKARRAAKGNTSTKGQSMVGQLKLTKLRKNRTITRRQWLNVYASVENVDPAPAEERVRWKGKTKLSGRSKLNEWNWGCKCSTKALYRLI